MHSSGQLKAIMVIVEDRKWELGYEGQKLNFHYNRNKYINVQINDTNLTQ